MGAYGKDVMRPKVAIHMDRYGARLQEKKLVDLGTEKELFVKRALQSDDKLAF